MTHKPATARILLDGFQHCEGAACNPDSGIDSVVRSRINRGLHGLRQSHGMRRSSRKRLGFTCFMRRKMQLK